MIKILQVRTYLTSKKDEKVCKIVKYEDKSKKI